MLDIENMETEVTVAAADKPATKDGQQVDTGTAGTPEQDGKLPKYLEEPAAAGTGNDKEAGEDAEKAIEARIAAERQKWEKELQAKSELDQLSPEEQSQRKIAQLESELRVTKLKDAAVAKLSGDEYPVELADILDYSSEDSADASFQRVTEAFKNALSAAMKARIKGKTPAGLGGAAKTENNVADIVAKNIRGGL